MSKINDILGVKETSSWKNCGEHPLCSDIIVRELNVSENFRAYTLNDRNLLNNTELLRQIFNGIEDKYNYGIYFLYNSKTKEVYVGQSIDGYKRLVQHQNTPSERYYTRWDRAIIFIGDLKYHLDDIEAVFIKMYKSYEDIESLNTIKPRICNIKDVNTVINYSNLMLEVLSFYKLVTDNDLDKVTSDKDFNELVQQEINSIDVDTIRTEVEHEVIEEYTKRVKEKYKVTDELVAKALKIREWDNVREEAKKASNLILWNRVYVHEFDSSIHFSDEVVTPKELVKKAIMSAETLSLYDGKHTFLDIASKSGVFIVEVINTLMSDDKNLPINQESNYEDGVLDKEILYNRDKRLKYIVENLVYAVALSKQSYLLTLWHIMRCIEQHLVAFQYKFDRLLKSDERVETVPRVLYIENYKPVILSKSSLKYEYLTEYIRESFIKQGANESMKFDVVVGNPPYQESNGGGNGASAVSIYNHFINLGEKLADQSVLIVPARWMSDNPNGIGSTELHKMRTRTNIKQLIDLKDEQPFEGANIAGGVCILHLDNSNTYARLDTLGVIIRDEENKNIITKIINSKFTSLSDIITSDCFRSGTHMNSGWKNFSSTQDNIRNIKYYCSNKDSILGYGYVSKNDIIKNHNVVNEYKVAMKSASPTNNDVIYKGMVLEPGSCCSRTYIVIHNAELVNSEEKANNIVKYLSTKFARFCVRVIKTTQNASAQAYKFVPLQDFGTTSDIDWSQSTSDIDKQLYKKYNLTDDEINYIENKISIMV